MRFIFLILISIASFVNAQVVDNFNDGDFTNAPTWSGNNTDFTIVGGQLRSNASTASYGFYLSTPSAIATNAQWEFYVDLQFNTSSTNYVDIYLISDSANLKSTTNSGYFVRIGNSTDEISLYKKTAGTSIKIIDGLDAQTNKSNNTIKIKVTHNAQNLWTLQRDLTGTGTNYFTEGTITDATILTSSYFGIFIKQSTASFFLKHFFDDVTINPIILDVTAPTIVSSTVVSDTGLDVLFNENVDFVTSQVLANYNANNTLGNPTKAIRDSVNFSLVHLTFTTPFTSGVLNVLSVNSVQDMNGNPIINATTNFCYYKINPFDIVINEIMADPDPVVNTLPNSEYVELYNKTAFAINLNNWTFSVGTNSKILPTIIIPANGFMVLTSTTAAPNFSADINVAGITSFPALTNTGQTISLKTPQGAVISTVSYTDEWYKDENKQDGGWSLEQIDPTNPCAGENNWRASKSINGGTPGVKNSIFASNPDHTPPELLRVSIISVDTILLYFNEPLDSSTILNPTLYNIDNHIGIPTQIKVIAPDFKSVRLSLGTELQSGIIYNITINNGITDCVGNEIKANNTVRFAIPEPALSNDIVINEILFDPKEGGVDFVEIYNRSNKVIDLKTITLSQYDTLTDLLTSVCHISSMGYLIFPQEYLVLSENNKLIKDQYFTTNPKGFLNLSNLPSMNIDEGTVCLATPTNIIDQLHYYSTMHFGLLKDTKGISLERIDFNRYTQEKSNWHSAAASVGYATPGYKNSQYINTDEADNPVEISPEIFSPDEDGLNDVVNINYSFDVSGYIANISIYDSKGQLTKLLVRNELLGVKGTFSWDGINEEREKARIGIYIIYFEVFDLSGNVKHYKKTCVLGGKL
jgi:hypothetical protein